MTRALIVEDNPMMAASLQRQVSEVAGHCTVVGNAIDAMDEIDTVKPDVILLDLLLPGATSLALLHELRSHADLADIPVVVISTISDQLDGATLAPYGVTHVLDKTTMVPRDVAVAVTEALA